MEPLINKIYGLIIAAIVIFLLYLLKPILTPFLDGALLAYLVDPLVNQLMRLRLPRWLAVSTVFLFLFLVLLLFILLLIPLIETQINRLIDASPTIILWVQNTIIPVLKSHFGIQDFMDIEGLKSSLSENWAKAGGVASWVVKTILHSGFTLLGWTVNLILIPVVTFYLLYDWDEVINGIHGLLPRRYEPTIVKLVVECDTVLSAFLRGQFLVMVTLGLIYSVALSLYGLQFGLIIGLAVGLFSIVPHLGVIVGILSASIAAYIQFGTFNAVWPIFILFGVVQTLDGMLLTPKLVGHRIGLHPVAVIFAVLAGAALGGFFGVLLALPVAAVIMVLVRFLHQRYCDSNLYRV